MTHQVFLSYSSRDQGIADAIVKAMESGGIGCWIASRNIKAGEDYAECILQAISTSKVMVVVFSTNSNVSRHVMREVERAIHYGNAIIPFKIDGVDPTKSMEYYFSTVQWLDATRVPIQNHFNILYDRVRQIISDTKDLGQAANGKIITAKQRKAFNLAYNADKNKSLNPSHAAFWLGSRYLPGFDLFEIMRKQNLQNRQMVDKALFSEFEKYEQQMGFDIGFRVFFISLVGENDPKKKHVLRQAFIHKMIDSIGANHGPRIASIWMLGILLSTLWLWTKRGRSGNANEVIKAKIDETFNSISKTLLLIDIPSALKDDFNEIHRDTQKYKNLKTLQDCITVWTAQIEMYLLVEEYEISFDNAEMLLQINPQLATFVLQQYLKKSPDDGGALILIGKASLKIINEGLTVEPLFVTDPEKNLTWSMKRSIQLNPDSEWSKRAAILLKKLKPI